MNLKILYTGIFISFIVSTTLLAQEGVSSSSMGVARAGSNGIRVGEGRFVMPSPETFRIEEFVNYHHHEIPIPSMERGQRVKLSVQSTVYESGERILQIGLATPEGIDPELMPPLDVVFVIDRSGSMSGTKMKDVKRAMRALVSRFRKNDRVSIVSFSNDATVDLEACGKTKSKEIEAAIDSIDVGGGTNLYAGLMLGFEQALKNNSEDRAGRIIFLTDGNANVGVTESKDIAERSRRCLKDGISLATIGLGVDFNHGLLRELSDSGRGTMHYVGDSKDIQKTFVEEFDSLLAPAAREVRLTIDMGRETEAKFFGYDPKEKSPGRFVFNLDDLGHGATQVVLASISSGEETGHQKKRRSDRKGSKKLSGYASLTYIDAITKEEVETKVSFDKIEKSDRSSIDPNYAIALVAESLKDAAECSAVDKNKSALGRLERASKKVMELMKKEDAIRVGDPNVDRMLDLSENYVRLLKQGLKED